MHPAPFKYSPVQSSSLPPSLPPVPPFRYRLSPPRRSRRARRARQYPYDTSYHVLKSRSEAYVVPSMHSVYRICSFSIFTLSLARRASANPKSSRQQVSFFVERFLLLKHPGAELTIQFSACGACRMRRVRCDLKDLQAANPSSSLSTCSNCQERGLRCVYVQTTHLAFGGPSEVFGLPSKPTLTQH